MRKKWMTSAISILGIMIVLFCVIFKFFTEKKVTKESKKGNSTIFATLPITNWTNTRFPTPCLSMKIGDETISSIVDLGFCGMFSINSKILEQIQEKKYLGPDIMYGFNGKKFEKKVYEVPNIKVGGVTYYDALVKDEDHSFGRNACIYTENEEPSPSEPGRIGWEFFEPFGVFFDIDNDKIVICDSIETLKNEGYAVELFTKTPLICDRGFIEIDVETPNGHMLCALDTGCTFNCLHAYELVGQTKFDMENITKFSQFKIAEDDFGPINFLRIAIQLPVHVECVLGMEFFNKHIVFLDFKNKIAYFAPSPSPNK